MGAVAPIVAIATTALSTAASVAGSIQQGRAAKQQADYQAAVARNNQIIAQRKADDARERGRLAELQKRRETAQLIGRQRAGAAARGVEVDSGSAVDITADTAAFGELDALTIRSNAEREALGFEAEANQFEAEGQLRRLSGRNQRTGSYFAAGGTLLSGGSKVADKWYTFYGS